jgi:hypothetical protein
VRNGTGRPGRAPGAIAGACTLALGLVASPGRAAERTLTEFWPELDVFVQLDGSKRLFLLGAITRAAETGTSTEATFGVHLDWFPAGLPRRLLDVAPGLDGRWSLWTRVGYNHVAAWNASAPSEERLLLEATLRSEPSWGSVRLANRSRLDLRAIGDQASWRYRNRTRVERTWTLRGADAPTRGPFSAVTPYAMLEFFWDSRESDWSRRLRQFGIEFEMAHERSIDVYLARQDDLREAGARLWVGGFALTLRY